MKLPKHAALLIALAATSFTFTACDDDKVEPQTGELDIEFENVAGTKALVLTPSNPSTPIPAAALYTNTAGNQFTVSKFNYIISNIKLTRANDTTTWREEESYHLIKHDEPESKKFTLKGVPAGDYSKITFIIGVDEARNTAGAQTGALAPDNDMFWTWNSGYIFVKMEGEMQSNPSVPLVFHIGGFRSPNNTIRTVSPALPASTGIIRIRPNSTPEVHMRADLLKMFNGPNAAANVNFNTLSNTMGGADAVRVANNYSATAGMFTVDHIHAN